jgi:hypothetical protein
VIRHLSGTTAALPADPPARYPWSELISTPEPSESTMTIQRDAATQAVLSKLLEEHNLAGDARLYREAMRDSLIPTGQAGVYSLAANANPSESVVDIYGPGYVVQADQVGPGLAFAESASPDWQETMELRTLRASPDKLRSSQDRVEVEVRLGDILRQGGLIYPVESVTVEQAWYCTLPDGKVDVREAS